MATLLKQNPDLCLNPDALDSAAVHLSSPGITGPTSWHYELSGLMFRVKTPPASAPSTLPSHLIITIDVRATGDSTRSSIDPFNDLAVNFSLRPDQRLMERRDAWHFDRHRTDNKLGKPIPSDYVHPLYHLEQGGMELALLHDNIGDFMLVIGPRIGLPPMDAILAIDYVISNYSGEHWQILRSDSQYEQLISRAQNCFWLPHFAELAAHLSGGNPSKARLLQPTLF